ncbi:hypothetical protein [Haloarcula regularis]|uniref:hypothetical protein n=1 Tax=Haloarcula regularis TaxID=3033392 RepID=UPI0023E7EB7F|nr:hypothetical protein [Halomicroarcula sp. SYNS111]
MIATPTTSSIARDCTPQRYTAASPTPAGSASGTTAWVTSHGAPMSVPAGYPKIETNPP